MSTIERGFKDVKQPAINPPLGLLYIASYLESLGHEVHLIDGLALNLTLEQMVAQIKALSAVDFIGVTCATATFYRAKEIISRIRDFEKDTKIILGGAHVTALPVDSLRTIPELDYGVIGEGEITFSELLIKESYRVNGIAYRSGSEVKFTPRREYIKDLDMLPFPARHLLPDMKLYHSGLKSLRKPVASMITSRGCPFNCIFCSKIVFGSEYRYHSPSYVYNEVSHLISRYNIKEVTFYDDNFTLKRQRLFEICNKLSTLDITWSCLGRIGLDKESLKKMHEAGCWNIAFGVESGNPEVLKFIKKDLKLEKVKRTIVEARKCGIEAKGYFMLGLPLETEKTIQDTIDFAKSLPFDSVEFAITVPYPGTELYNIANEYGRFNNESYDNYLSLFPENVSFVPSGLSEKILKSAQKRAYKEFYFRPRYIIQRLSKFNQLMKNLKGMKAMIKQVS